MTTIATGASTQHNDAIARLHFAWVAPTRQHAEASTKDERVIKVPFIIENGTVDGGDAHLITVVTYTIDYTASDTPGWKNTCRQFLDRRIQWAKAEDIGAGNWLRRDAQYIANDTTHAGIRAAEGLNRRRMIMRLDLEGDIVRLRKANNTGVVAKG